MVDKLNIILFLIVCALTSVLSGRCRVADIEDDGENGLLTQNCLRCISEVVGGSHIEECTPTSCGPFMITYVYWQSAFNQTDDDKQAEYRTCTTKPWCSLQTVHEHMKRFLPKCVNNSHDRPVCESALALHIYGTKNCTMTLQETPKKKLYDCLDKHTKQWLTGNTP